MIRNYLKIAWRNIYRNKSYSALNIVGLGIGMAIAMLIGLWVYNQYSYDKFLPNYERLYETRINYYGNGDTMSFKASSLKLADALRTQVPGIESVSETDYFGPHGLKVGDKKFYMNGGQTGSDFLKMFQYPMLAGNANSALNDPYSIVLTESTAKTLFGQEDAMNKTVRFDNKHEMQVTGILKDIPANSSLQFNYLVPFSYYEANDEMTGIARHRNFQWNGYKSFVLLKPGVSFATVARQVRDIEKSETDNIMSPKTNILLQPMSRWRLYDRYENGVEAGGFIEYVRMFTIIGALILLIACINFINLSTARSEKRAREVGVRKTIGSLRRDLIAQFLLESVLLTLLAFLFSGALVWISLPAFNALTGGQLVIPFSNGIFWLVLVSGLLTTALAAGSRPAFYLSSFNPVKVLKGTFQTGKTAGWSRKLLVVIQFSCSIALIVATAIIYQQIQYARSRPSGFNLNRLLMTDMNQDLGHSYAAIKNELLQKRIAVSVTSASDPATQPGGHRDVDGFPGKRPDEILNVARISVCEDYFKTLGMTMKEGRDFQSAADTMNVIFNEAAIKLMRLKDPVNQYVNYLGDKLRIVGVVKDGVTVSPYAPADPAIYLFDPNPRQVIMYRLSPGISDQVALQKLAPIFNRYNPAFPYTYKFADEEYAVKFSQEMLVGKLAGVFALLAVFISCLGLLGFGIRKTADRMQNRRRSATGRNVAFCAIRS